MIGNAGLLFPEDDVDALREHLQRLANDSAERTRLGQAGRARVLERFTMARIAQETVAVYLQMREAAK